MLDEPQFTDMDSFQDRIQTMHRAVTQPLVWREKVVPGVFVIEDQATGQYYGKASERYEIAQNPEVMIPFGLALGQLNDAGVPFRGSVTESEKGKMIAVVEIGEGKFINDSVYRQVVMIGNSYNQSTALDIESAVRRLICGNGMFSIVGVTSKSSMKHINDVEKEAQSWYEKLLQYAEDTNNLGTIIDRANAIELDYQMLEPLYRGIGIKARTALNIVSNIHRYVPEIVRKPTVWNAYNGGTNEFSHRAKGSFENNTANLAMCARLLSVNEDAIHQYVKIGEGIIKDEEDHKRQKEIEEDEEGDE